MSVARCSQDLLGGGGVYHDGGRTILSADSVAVLVWEQLEMLQIVADGLWLDLVPALVAVELHGHLDARDYFVEDWDVVLDFNLHGLPDAKLCDPPLHLDVCGLSRLVVCLQCHGDLRRLVGKMKLPFVSLAVGLLVCPTAAITRGSACLRTRATPPCPVKRSASVMGAFHSCWTRRVCNLCLLCCGRAFCIVSRYLLSSASVYDGGGGRKSAYVVVGVVREELEAAVGGAVCREELEVAVVVAPCGLAGPAGPPPHGPFCASGLTPRGAVRGVWACSGPAPSSAPAAAHGHIGCASACSTLDRLKRLKSAAHGR